MKPRYSDEHARFLTYLKAVGTGPKGNRDLTSDDLSDAFELILKQAVPAETIGAFLIGWRVKRETTEELRGAVSAIHKYLRHSHPLEGVELGYPLDGKIKSAPVMLKSAELLSSLKVHVAGDDRQSPKFGYNPKQFHEEMGFTDNVNYHDRRIFAPELSRLTPLRNNLGLRSAINTIEKLNFLAPTALIGMHHAPYFDLYAELYAPHYGRLLIIQGSEGTPEVLKKAKMVLIENGERRSISVDPEAFGITPLANSDESTIEQMCRQLEDPDENLQKLITLNAAIIGFAAGMFESVEIGYNTLTNN